MLTEAVAYIPAFLEDRAAMVKERANGLYGPTAFLIANTIIGLPFLCKPSSIWFDNSSDCLGLHISNVLAHESPSFSNRSRQLSANPLSGPRSSRVIGDLGLFNFSNLCSRVGSNCFCEWTLDDSRRFSRDPNCFERLLEVYLPPNRLSAVCFRGLGTKSIGWEHL